MAGLVARESRASTLVPQVPLPGECIPQFAVPLPVFGPGYNAALPRVDAVAHPFLAITMKETERAVLPPPPAGADRYPATAVCPAPPALAIQPTRVWAYETSDWITGKVLGPAFWPAVTLEARRFVPTTILYQNALPAFDPADPLGPGLVQGLVTVDQTIHWADPDGLMCMHEGMGGAGCRDPYVGSPPAVPHLHGGEVPSEFDGGPNGWFTPDGRTGTSFHSIYPAGPGKAVYQYLNSQEPGTPWFHDHALGATRTNVYSGLQAFYFIRDPLTEPARLPSGAYEIELAVQARQFDTRGQLLFPDGSLSAMPGMAGMAGAPPNPDVHPFWIPEFTGDVTVVNGSPWPYLQVEPRRYRLRILNGSNARFYNLSFGGAPVWQIGADDAYLDRPVKVETVFIAPGERADVIVDLSLFGGTSLTVTDDAPVPYPDGDVPGVDQPQMANVMQLRVVLPRRGADTSCDPAAGGCARPAVAPLARLTSGDGALARGVRIDRVRQLVLKEHQGYDADGNEMGPLEVLVNNIGFAAPVTERPRVGSTELWEIVNLTADAHPMHTHLVQFQVLNRETLAPEYGDLWAAAFAGKCVPDRFAPDNPCPGFGPPNAYGVPNADGAVGGNPAVSGHLLGDVTAPLPEERGWKDTAKSNPGQVLRLVVRFAPTSTPVGLSAPGRNLFPFDPTQGPGYVWHCHIVDHEDNDMMRPYLVAP
jgi:FtsP/CotA-like multicopper oxidase with cupredoxin domain